MNIITDPFFYMVAVPIVLLFGMGKGGLGPGFVTLSVPVLSFVIDPVQAAAILLPILCMADIFAVYRFRRDFDSRHLRILIPASLVGVCIAYLLMGQLDGDKIRLIIGAMAILFCLDYWLRPDISKGRVSGRWSGYLWGTVAGFTSTQVHAGGPPVSIYLLPQKLDKVILMGTMAMFFAVVNYAKIVPYFLVGALNGENLMTSLVLLPLAPIGVLIGHLLMYKINQTILYRFLYIALFLSGIKLVLDSYGVSPLDILR